MRRRNGGHVRQQKSRFEGGAKNVEGRWDCGAKKRVAVAHPMQPQLLSQNRFSCDRRKFMCDFTSSGYKLLCSFSYI